jgi:hypothetical protein
MENRLDDRGLTLLIVGAGAVENSWPPILRALRNYYDFDLTSDGANSFLARIVYLMRWHSALADPAAKKELVTIQRTYEDVCSRIRSELRAAQRSGELRIRPEFNAVVECFLVRRRTRFAVISTNWDSIIEDALTTRFAAKHACVVSACHLHGGLPSEEPLYLPSELAREAYRGTVHVNALGGLHAGALDALGRARHVVLYGLSLSPLDAELCQTLASGWHDSNLQSVDIVDPDHMTVAHRVNLLADPRRTVTVLGFNPSALDAPVNYTIRRATS